MPRSFQPQALPSDLKEALSALPEHLSERVRHLQGNQLRGAAKLSGAKAGRPSPGPIVYWTHHAQRVDENPALDVARLLASFLSRPLLVYQGLSQTYCFASDRHHRFQLEGAKQLERRYRELGLRYVLHVETSDDAIPALLQVARQASVLITEDFPGEPTGRWIRRLIASVHSPILAVDTACIVPMQQIGRSYDRAFAFRDATKQMVRARIDRPWPTEVSDASEYDGPLPFVPVDLDSIDLGELVAGCAIDHGVAPVADTLGGTDAGYARWADFVAGPIRQYAAKRNDPCADVSSKMSAYLHYGMVSPMRLAREANAMRADKYLDELIQWRELAYTYCFYNHDHDRVSTLPTWALRTLSNHEADTRPAILSWETLSRAQTEDRLWNACQMSLMRHGELHNNVRMTWGKALLQWTRNAEHALRLLIDLNHRYALDGRDPASYGGILWCLGQFDRPFEPEQRILGTVRGRSSEEHAGRLRLDAYERRVQRPIARRSMRVAVIGAGVGGTMCARTLADHGLDVVVFEKSRGLGGRCATRRTSDGGMVDHGPPYLVFRDPLWSPHVESWAEDGIIQPWNGTVVRIDSDGSTRPTQPEKRWVGSIGLNALGKHLAQGLSVQLQKRVVSVVPEAEQYRLMVEPTDNIESTDGTHVTQVASDAGWFDAVVWNTPPIQIEPLIPGECSWRQSLDKYAMIPQWVVMVSLADRWPTPFDGAWVSDDTIAWIGRETSKPGRRGLGEHWIVHATGAWSREHLENAPEQVAERLLERLQRIVQLPMPAISKITSHRWRYSQAEALADNLKKTDCLWDSHRRLGACGDWLRASGVEGALSSGRAMAGRILSDLTQSGPGESARPGFQQLRLF